MKDAHQDFPVLRTKEGSCEAQAATERISNLEGQQFTTPTFGANFFDMEGGGRRGWRVRLEMKKMREKRNTDLREKNKRIP